jgi:hypothetical protein
VDNKQQAPLPPEVEQRIQELLDDYLERRRAGEDPDEAELLLDHPDIAEALACCLEALALVELHHHSHPSGPAGAGDLPFFIDRYQVSERIGRGASASVYRAWDPKLTRFVALKVLHWDPAEHPTQAQRFERDA